MLVVCFFDKQNRVKIVLLPAPRLIPRRVTQYEQVNVKKLCFFQRRVVGGGWVLSIQIKEAPPQLIRRMKNWQSAASLSRPVGHNFTPSSKFSPPPFSFSLYLPFSPLSFPSSCKIPRRPLSPENCTRGNILYVE